MSLELLQILNPFYQYYLFIVQGVRTAEGQCSTQNLHVLTNDENWTVTPETHKYAAAAGSFCFVTSEKGRINRMFAT